LLTPDGPRPIDELKLHDLVLSRSEDDPEGPVEARRVVSIFQSYSPLLDLHVGGQVVRTTAEHPFWVVGQGWVAAHEIQAGDMLLGVKGEQTPVDSVEGPTAPAPVYNIEVEEYHTYWVGTPLWGFAIWSHNAGVCGPNAPSNSPLWTPAKGKTGVGNALGHWKKHGSEFPEIPNATQYAQRAKDFATNPPSGTLTKMRPNGDRLFYDPTTNTFAVQRADGALRTMFRPSGGMNYWNLQ
jgi:hypothetical protein